MSIAARIRKVGIPTGELDKRKHPICMVTCQGCGEEIRSDEDLGNVDYVKTKRGTEWFFHRRCQDQVWKRKIV